MSPGRGEEGELSSRRMSSLWVNLMVLLIINSADNRGSPERAQGVRNRKGEPRGKVLGVGAQSVSYSDWGGGWVCNFQKQFTQENKALTQ